MQQEGFKTIPTANIVTFTSLDKLQVFALITTTDSNHNIFKNPSLPLISISNTISSFNSTKTGKWKLGLKKM